MPKLLTLVLTVNSPRNHDWSNAGCSPERYKRRNIRSEIPRRARKSQLRLSRVSRLEQISIFPENSQFGACWPTRRRKLLLGNITGSTCQSSGTLRGKRANLRGNLRGEGHIPECMSRSTGISSRKRWAVALASRWRGRAEPMENTTGIRG